VKPVGWRPCGSPPGLSSPAEAALLCRSRLLLKAVAGGGAGAGPGQSVARGGAELAWPGSSPAPGTVLLRGKGRWLGFSPKPGCCGNQRWCSVPAAASRPLLSIGAGPPVDLLHRALPAWGACPRGPCSVAVTRGPAVTSREVRCSERRCDRVRAGRAGTFLTVLGKL